VVDFLDFFLFLFFLLVLTFFFDFALVIFFLFVFHFIVFISDFLFFSFFNIEFNWELDEFGVFADDVLGLLFVELLELVIFHVEDEFGTSGKVCSFFWGGRSYTELFTSRGLPYIRVVVILL